jgi:hypothetical protein
MFFFINEFLIKKWKVNNNVYKFKAGSSPKHFYDFLLILVIKKKSKNTHCQKIVYIFTLLSVNKEQSQYMCNFY